MFGISQLTNPLLIFGEKLATVDVWWFHSNVHCEMYEEFRTFMTAAKAEYNKAVPHQVKSLFQEFTNHKKIGDANVPAAAPVAAPAAHAGGGVAAAPAI